MTLIQMFAFETDGLPIPPHRRGRCQGIHYQEVSMLSSNSERCDGLVESTVTVQMTHKPLSQSEASQSLFGEDCANAFVYLRER